MSTETASMINVGTNVSTSRDGTSVTFSINPQKTWWPSDTGLPLGQPYTSEIHFMG